MLIGLGYGPAARTCEHTNEPASVTKLGKFSRDDRLLKITVVLDVTNSAYLSTSHPLSADYFLKDFAPSLDVNSIFYARPYPCLLSKQSADVGSDRFISIKSKWEQAGHS